MELSLECLKASLTKYIVACIRAGLSTVAGCVLVSISMTVRSAKVCIFDERLDRHLRYFDKIRI
jgi:hypothetical protein